MKKYKLQEKSFYLTKEQINSLTYDAEELCKFISKIIITTKNKLQNTLLILNF